MTDEGRVEGTALYVYGSVTADGREMNGDTVKGTWASKGCDSSQGQLESGKGGMILTVRIVHSIF